MREGVMMHVAGQVSALLISGEINTHTRTTFSHSEHLARNGQNLNSWFIHGYFEMICGRSTWALQLTVALSED